MMEWECNEKRFAVFKQRYKLTEEECSDIFLRSYCMLFGIAAMIATDKIDLTNEEAIDMVKRTVAQLADVKKG